MQASYVSIQRVDNGFIVKITLWDKMIMKVAKSKEEVVSILAAIEWKEQDQQLDLFSAAGASGGPQAAW